MVRLCPNIVGKPVRIVQAQITVQKNEELGTGTKYVTVSTAQKYTNKQTIYRSKVE